MDQVACGGGDSIHRRAQEGGATLARAFLAERVALERRKDPSFRKPAEALHRREAESVLAEAVASEHLVASMAAQEDGGARARGTDQEPGRERRAVADGLAQPRQHRAQRAEAL